MILRGTKLAEVVGSNTDERVIEIKKGNQWESEEYTMLAIKNFGPFGAQPIVHVELKMRITTDELNYFDKEEAESELIYPKVPELQHN
jgi:hypothetical protein